MKWKTYMIMLVIFLVILIATVLNLCKIVKPSSPYCTHVHSFPSQTMDILQQRRHNFPSEVEKKRIHVWFGNGGWCGISDPKTRGNKKKREEKENTHFPFLFFTLEIFSRYLDKALLFKKTHPPLSLKVDILQSGLFKKKEKGEKCSKR